MDPNYQQAMIQALMGGQSLAPGMGGQNASTPYGQGFMTGNMMQPTANMNSNAAAANSMGSSGQGLNSAATLSNNGTTQLQQPMATYTG